MLVDSFYCQCYLYGRENRQNRRNCRFWAHPLLLDSQKVKIVDFSIIYLTTYKKLVNSYMGILECPSVNLVNF